MTDELDLEWETIPGFSNYGINQLGDIIAFRTSTILRPSTNNYGHMKISLYDDSGRRRTRSVAHLVASTFIPEDRPIFDHLILLNGDLEDVAVSNLQWRPSGFAWKYMHQMKIPQPRHYYNLHIFDETEELLYESVIAAGISNGLLFDDVWNSTHSQTMVFPTMHTFKVVS